MLLPPARAGVDTDRYQMPMAAAPKSVTEAIATLPDRKKAVIRAVACGQELEFVSLFQSSSNSEDIAVLILGKLAWLQQGRPHNATVSVPPIPPCEFTGDATVEQVCRLFEPKCKSPDTDTRLAAILAFRTNPIWTFLPSSTNQLRTQIISLLPACADRATQAISIASTTRPNAPPDTISLTISVSERCLRGEIDGALLRIERGDSQVGSGGVPCHFFGATKGDWDSTLKTLIRVAELDRKDPILGSAARTKLNDRLIDIDGGPAQERYFLWECGNEEQSVGDPQTRSDDRDGVGGILDDIWDNGWDIAWFLLTLLLIYLFFWVLPFLLAFGPIAAAAAAAVAVALIAASLLITIPETENHLWMINSTKYLNNQRLIANGATGYSGDQSALREWILKEMQKVLKSDFIEYNSRPYARYSMVSLGNLAEFSTDIDVSTGARAILEYSIAKYSVTSSEGRRIPPFRRKREDLVRVDGNPRKGTADTAPNGLFDLISGSDHLHAVGLYFFGSTLNLPPFGDVTYAATTAGYPPHAIYYATSGYRPDDATYVLAMERSSAHPVHQRLHFGLEIVSSGEAFTITAGGHTTDIAKAVTGNFIDKFFKRDDLGAAVPTTLMLAGPPDIPPGLNDPEHPHPAVPRPPETRRSSLERFLRFEGQRPKLVEDYPSYDRNLCVWDGFACGVNIVIPADLKAPCMTADPRFGWNFIRSDSPACPGYNTGPLFWIALYYKSGPAIDKSGWGSVDSFGFFEIVDGAEMSFDVFKTRVLQRNPGPGDPMHLSGDCGGVYVSARGATGQRLQFSCERVTKVDAAEQPALFEWTLAGTPAGALGVAPIQSSGNGNVEIVSAAGKRKVVLNFERWADPRFDTVNLP